jgi:hypothetical protein
MVRVGGEMAEARELMRRIEGLGDVLWSSGIYKRSCRMIEIGEFLCDVGREDVQR